MKLFACALNGFVKASVLEGFQQVVKGVDLECAHGMFVVSGHKNNQWQPLAVQGRKDSKSIQARHLNIQEYQVG